MNKIYPPTPQGLDESILKPGAAFKNEVIKVALGISLFAIVYILLFSLAAALALLCAVAGFSIIVAKPMLFTIALGVGLIGLGGMVFFFLIKFIFNRKKIDTSNLVEISETDQPLLFNFVRQLSEETGTRFPKKIFVSPEVNASVFYNTNFWSMLLPTRKNLQIGLGLVNALNLSEFKAVVAHEFGHFSQRSMKLGSYVYNVNHIIYDMLYENDGYGKTIEAWANVSGYFALFAHITIGIVSGIQWVLQGMYQMVNKSYMGLSRQMEFHADAISAYVTGSDHLVTALCRLEFADLCYQSLLDCYEEWFAEHIMPENLYANHTEVMRQFASQHDIAMEGAMMNLDLHSMDRFNRSRLNIKNQWASHPSLSERAQQLDKLAIPFERFSDSAWKLFQAPKQLQQRLTAHVYKNVQFKENPVVLNSSDFEKKFQHMVNERTLHPVFKGFFDRRKISRFELQDVINETNAPEHVDFSHVFSEDRIAAPGRIRAMEGDIQTVQAIGSKTSGIKTFDFDGVKYSIRESKRALSQLETDLNAAKQQLVQFDKEAFRYFYNAAKAKGQSEVVIAGYTALFDAEDTFEQDMDKVQKLVSYFSSLFQGTLTAQQAFRNRLHLEKGASTLKQRLREMMQKSEYQDICTADQKKLLDTFLSRQQTYFTVQGIHEGGHNLLYSVLNVYVYLVRERTFKIKKQLLDQVVSHYVEDAVN